MTGMVTYLIVWVKLGWDTFLSKEVSNEDHKCGIYSESLHSQ